MWFVPAIVNKVIIVWTAAHSEHLYFWTSEISILGASICGKGKERVYLEHLYFLDKILKENAILIVVQEI